MTDDESESGVASPVTGQYEAHGAGQALFRWLSGVEKPPLEALYEGVAGCVAGETELWDPIACVGRRIDELCARGERPWVLTLDGPVQADVPYVRGRAPLWRFTTVSGRAILVSLQHRFMTRDGWRFANAVDATMELRCEDGWDRVASITYERTDFFYDLGVPGAEHYLAHGLWNHNCGKSRCVAEFVKAVCNNYPTSSVLLLRKTRVDLAKSFLKIFENEVLGPNHPAVLNGPTREHRMVYRHPALGGEVVCAGMEDPTRVFSTQYDVIIWEEATEAEKDQWESLHRALRVGPMPFRILIGMCNPDSKYHWLNQRCNEGRCKRLVGKFWDNPVFFDHETETWTPQGEEYLGRLRNQVTGHRKRQLYDGEWVAAEGLVWPNYDPAVHLIQRKDVPAIDAYVGSIDWGFTDPGCLQVWGVDREKRCYRVAEVYRVGKTFEWWAEIAVRLKREYGVKEFVADPSRPDNIQQLNDWFSRLGEGRIVRGADNRKTARPGAKMDMVGLDLVRWGFNRAKDGKPRIYLVEGALLEGPDPLLKGLGKPYSLEMELPAYTYKASKDSRPVGEDTDPACADHACLPAETPILTVDGWVPIADVQVGAEVVTPLGIGVVSACGMTDPDAELWSLGNLRATGNHPIATTRGFLAVDRMRYDDILIEWDYNQSRKSGMDLFGGGIQRARSARRGSTSDARMGRGTSTSIEQSTSATSGQFLADITSTTRTETKAATLQKIWSYLRRVSMRGRIGQKSEPEPPQPACWDSTTLRNLGIGRTLAELGIEPTLPSSTAIRRALLYASFAGLNTRRKALGTHDSAQTTARPPGGVERASTMWRERAVAVAVRFWSIDTPNRRTAPARVGCSVPTGQRAPVYNLTVEPFGCYFAAGYLVSNCDTSRYLCMHVWGRTFAGSPPPFKFPVGTWGWRMRYDEVFGPKGEDEDDAYRWWADSAT